MTHRATVKSSRDMYLVMCPRLTLPAMYGVQLSGSTLSMHKRYYIYGGIKCSLWHLFGKAGGALATLLVALSFEILVELIIHAAL